MKKQATKKTDSPKSGLPETAASDSPLCERIERKAYELYEKRGRVGGLDVQDWLEAERLVLAETKAETVAKGKRPSRERTEATKSG